MSTATAAERSVTTGADAEQLFRLGLICSSGDSVRDMVSAHKWFNIAAMRGCSEAVHRRCEIAGEMTSREIAAAQRAARAWLTRH